MPQNASTNNADVGLEVVDGLKNTSTWIKSQFDEFRTQMVDVIVQSEPVSKEVDPVMEWIESHLAKLHTEKTPIIPEKSAAAATS